MHLWMKSTKKQQTLRNNTIPKKQSGRSLTDEITYRKGESMANREKVVQGLEKLRKDLGYGLPERSNVVIEYLNSLTDAISMLKEQEPIKNLPSVRTKYCSECGRRMKWE